MHDGAAGLDAGHVVLPRRRVERHQHVDVARPALVAQRASPDVEPRRQPLDVRGEDVLGGHRYSKTRDGVCEHEIRGLTSRAVDRGHPNGEIVDVARSIEL